MVLKRVIGDVREVYSYWVTYEQNEEKFGMYVRGENLDDAKQDLKRHVSNARILTIEMKWPNE